MPSKPTDDQPKIVPLGPLEQRVMDAVWRRGDASVKDVTEDLNAEGEIAYTTVMTIMSRLADKGLLLRDQSARAYVYRPARSRAEFDETLSRSRVRELIKEFGDLAVTQFAEELRDVDPERALRLAEMLRSRGEP